MHVNVIKGRVDRIFYNAGARTLFLKLEGSGTLHELRVSASSPFVTAIMLTKPDDDVVAHEQNGRIDKWENRSMGTL